jgi:hypothetical protein
MKSFLFKVFWFFTKNFILQQCLNPNPNFFFGFGSSQNIRIISDSDPAKTFGLFRIRIHNTAQYHAGSFIELRLSRNTTLLHNEPFENREKIDAGGGGIIALAP